MHHDYTAGIPAIDKNDIECELIGGKELLVCTPLIGIHSNRKLKLILHDIECIIGKTSYLQVATIMKGLL